MSSTTFSGPVTSTAGFVGAVTGNVTGNVTGDLTGAVTGTTVNASAAIYKAGTGTVVNVADSTNTLAVTVALHGGRVVKTNDATLIITLPAIVAANIGVEYVFFVETAATAWKLTTDGTDKFVGSVLMVDTDSSGATTGYAPGATNDCINLDGSSTGGIAGSWVHVTTLALTKYFVRGVLLGSGSVGTPFADS